jgi:hypothetical protein
MTFTPAEVERLIAIMTPEERAQFEALMAQDSTVWRPQIGPQTEAYESRADITGYGGAAGGGKSDLVCGLALTAHQRSLIVRREKAQTEGFVQRLTGILGNSDGYNSQKSQWRLPGKLIELGGLDNVGDEARWQGRAHDLKAFDEVTEMREAQVRFIMGWTRSDDPNQRSRVIMTFNPPTTVEGRWVLKFFAPWLDDKHVNPAKPGELRWFTTIAGEDEEVFDSRPFVIVNDEKVYDFDRKRYRLEDIVIPKSRTFFPARVTDNQYYVNSGYITTLQAMPEPLRSQMLYGDFKAGIEDDPWQVIPTSWIDAAMDRWTAMMARGGPRKGPMVSLGADVAAGGKDNAVISPRYDLLDTPGVWFDDLIRIPGREIPQDRAGPIMSGRILMVRRDRAPVHIDVVGWGLSATNFLQENQVQVIPVNGAERSLERTRPHAHAGATPIASASMSFFNKRAEVVWRMRETLDPTNPVPAYLPDDSRVRADLASYRWQITSSGIKIGSKEDMKTQLGRSPDDGDALCLANMATVKTEVLEAYADEQEQGYDRFSEIL